MSDHIRERSISGGADPEDSDYESQNGDPSIPGKPGRKKNPNSQAARRDQNRIAQREFRLRKQQRIRDLEARVEILSGTKDEALAEMRNVLKDLMAENHTLRGLLRSLATFVGDGAGGLLPKMGWDLQDFNNYINKGETDTAWEGYQRRKKAPHGKKEDGDAPSSYTDKFTAPQGTQKRPSDVQVNGNATKRQRSGEKSYDNNTSNGFSMMVPMPASSIPPPQPGSIFPSAQPRPPEQDLFPDLLRSTNPSSFFIPPPSNTNTQFTSPNMDAYPRSFMSPVNIGMEQSSSTFYEPPTASTTSAPQPRIQQSGETGEDDDLEEDHDPKRNEAFKLINYHLDNYRRNKQYCLPASLRPSFVQRTVGHESVIDRVLHPELRDRMILLRDKYDLVDLLVDMRSAITIHGDDVLAHQNWELSETFIRKYSYLVDTSLLTISNRWRRERGEQEIVLSDDGLPPE